MSKTNINVGVLRGQNSPLFETCQFSLEMSLTCLGTVKLGRGLLQILSEGFHTSAALSCQTVLQRAGKTRQLCFIDFYKNVQLTRIDPVVLQLLNSTSYLQYQYRLPPCVLLQYYIVT